MPAGDPAATPAARAAAAVRSREYLKLLVVGAFIGLPVSAAAFGFLALVHELQTLVYTDLPESLGLGRTPVWWPLPLLAVSGALVAAIIRLLPGTGGHEPSAGFSAEGPPGAAELPGIVLAALVTLALGAVLGPEAPLIALGGGLGALAVRAARRGRAPAAPRAAAAAGAAGSFAAVSALLGSPLLGAFLLMEVSPAGAPTVELVLVPGLLAAGIGSLVFLGLGSWTGLGTYSLTLSQVPHVGSPTVGEFGWALVIGVAAACAGSLIVRASRRLAVPARRSRLPVTVGLGLVVAGLAIAYAEGTGRPVTDVLFSGQTALGPLLAHSASYSAGALVLLAACKGLAYAVSLGGFRGGPIFPSMFVGAAGGMALSHLPGLPVTAGFAMGVGALAVAMLRLPMTAVLLATLLLGRQGLAVMPLVIVAVVVAFVLVHRLDPPEAATRAHDAAPATPENPGGVTPAR